MTGFFKNWNMKKHLAVIVSMYTVILAAANCFMIFNTCRKAEKESLKEARWLKYISPLEKKKALAKSYVREPSKTSKIVNGFIGTCFAVDVASYPIIKKMLKKI